MVEAKHCVVVLSSVGKEGAAIILHCERAELLAVDEKVPWTMRRIFAGRSFGSNGTAASPGRHCARSSPASETRPGPRLIALDIVDADINYALRDEL